MFRVVGTETAIRKVAAGLKPVFEKGSGVMFISDTHVVRLDHLVAKESG